MISPGNYMKRWLHPVVFGAWTCILLYLYLSQGYIAFLRPEFGLLLLLAHLVTLGYMFAAFRPVGGTKMDISTILRALVLLLPLIYWISMPVTMLGSQAMKKRFLGTIAMDTQKQSEPALESEESQESLRPPDDSSKDTQTSPYIRTILELYRNPKYFQGKHVMISGMILRDEELRQYFGDRNTAVYRFMINCCAADAVPLVIMVDSARAEAFTNDQWVAVEGIFDNRQINGRPVPLIQNPVITAIETPAMPYMFDMPGLSTTKPSF